MFVLAHLSDVHLAPLPSINPLELVSKRGLGFLNWLRKRRGIHRRDVLDAVVTDLKAQKYDHIAFTGDLINLSLTNEYDPARAWLEQLGPARDVTFVPGNHDTYVRAALGKPEQYWGDSMRGDAGESFPFVRRRRKVALVGLSTSLPTLPLAATGRLHSGQLKKLGPILDALGREGLFRVIMIHHPPVQDAHHFRRLVDAEALRETLRKHGAELVLHGHHHEQALVWLAGPHFNIPCVGVPSASNAPDRDDDPAGYNLYEIDGEAGAWRCTAIMRAMSRGSMTITETMRTELADY
jgi:3',5'-cyclic AMP phosphodiesterase CpdA